MGYIEFNVSDIPNGKQEINLCLLAPWRDVSDGVGGYIDMAIESEADYYVDEGVEVEDWNVDFSSAWHDFCGELPHQFEQQWGEIFGDDKAIRFESSAYNVAMINGMWGSADVAMCMITVDAARLFALAHEHDVKRVHDGNGISGFIRTADDDYWVLLQVIQELMDVFVDRRDGFSAIYDAWQEDGHAGEFIEPVFAGA